MEGLVCGSVVRDEGLDTGGRCRLVVERKITSVRVVRDPTPEGCCKMRINYRLRFCHLVFLRLR